MWNRDQVPFLILTEVTAMGMGIHLENGSGSILDSDRGGGRGMGIHMEKGSGSILDSDRGDGNGNGYSRGKGIGFHS